MSNQKTLKKTNTKPKAQTKTRRLKKIKSVEQQREAAIRRFGVNDPRCGLCGHDDPLALEKHHIAGRKHDDITAIICSNCHRVISAHQRLHPQDVGERKNLLKTIGNFLLGLADLLVIAVKKLREFGEYLLDEASKLHVPDEEALA